MADTKSDRLRGTLELLILRTLNWGPRHGYAIVRWLSDTTRDKLRIEEGSLYPALYRMEKKGLLASDWKTSELGRPAKFYRLTPAGKKQLEQEMLEWKDFTVAVGRVLRTES